jgi:predicted HicB family RNase H-like nuclease
LTSVLGLLPDPRMARSAARAPQKTGEGIVGVRMPTALIAELKAAARERKISLGKLIQELWASHRAQPPPSR